VSFPYKFLVLKMRTLQLTKYMWKMITFHCLPSSRCSPSRPSSHEVQYPGAPKPLPRPPFRIPSQGEPQLPTHQDRSGPRNPDTRIGLLLGPLLILDTAPISGLPGYLRYLQLIPWCGRYPGLEIDTRIFN
jgi:hypothetical protein